MGGFLVCTLQGTSPMDPPGAKGKLSSKSGKWYRGYLKFLGEGSSFKTKSYLSKSEREGGVNQVDSPQNQTDIAISAGEFSSWTKQLFIIELKCTFTTSFHWFSRDPVSQFFCALAPFCPSDTVSQRRIIRRCFISFASWRCVNHTSHSHDLPRNPTAWFKFKLVYLF